MSGGGVVGDLIDVAEIAYGTNAVDFVTLGYTERVRRGKKDMETYEKQQAIAEADAKATKENQDEIKKRQIKMKTDEMNKRASAGNASGRDASVLATAALGAATGSTKKLLGE